MSLRISTFATVGSAVQADGDKGVKGDKGLKGLAYDSQFSRGYHVGGAFGPPGFSVSVITQTFPFSSPFSTADRIGDITQARNALTGQNSSSDGYVSGGSAPVVPGAVNTIDSFPFSTGFTTATDVGDLSQARFGPAGQSSSTDGYTSGGGTPTPSEVNTIDSFPFSTPFTTATDVGDLSQIRRNAAGQSSSTDGYNSGGFVIPFSPSNILNTIDRFPFTSPFTTATDVGDLSQERRAPAGQSSDTDGYSSGGLYGPVKNNIDSFPFSVPFTTATDVGDLSQGRYVSAGQSSSSDGYTSGGRNFNPYPMSNIIDKFPFSTPFTTATDSGDLNSARRDSAGLQG